MATVSSPPPPVGFVPPNGPASGDYPALEQISSSGGPTAPPQNGATVAPLPSGLEKQGPRRTAASNSSVFMKFIFQKSLLLALFRIVIYLTKLYEDGHAVVEYREEKYMILMALSVISLVSPSVLCAIYKLGERLIKDDFLQCTELFTQFLNGMFLIPWQMKRHLDTLYFASQRICHWRPPTEEETQEMKVNIRNAELLEFFEDLYAGLLQMVLQIYLVLLQYNFISEAPEVPPKILYLNMVASGFCIMSMLVSVRRRDDGPLTFVLSFIGWAALFLSRILSLSLAASAIHLWVLVLCLVHALGVSLWVYSIATESYLVSTSATAAVAEQSPLGSIRKRISLAFFVFLFFGVPSLLVWPIMFQLKEKQRPLKWLSIIFCENILLLIIWLAGHVSTSGLDFTQLQIVFGGALIGFTFIGVLFLTGYIVCKPKLTDQVMLHEIRTTPKEVSSWEYGIYYHFCDVVFKLPSTDRIGMQLDEIRRLHIAH